jgi:hypothetical protein
MSTEKEKSYSDNNEAELLHNKFKFLKCQFKLENEKDVHMGEIMFEIEQNEVYDGLFQVPN